LKVWPRFAETRLGSSEIAVGNPEPLRAGAEPDTTRRLEPARLPDHLDRLFRSALALSGSPHDAEDLVQETYARVLRKPRMLRHEDDQAYLLRALRNVWINWRQSAHSRRSVPLEPERLDFVTDPGADPQEHPLDARECFAAVADLSEPLREAIVAVDVMGLSYKEAASALRVRRGTVMSRLHRARQAVERAVEGPVEEVTG
jgi:RNA polymerase sigma-70 factor (ECF subfamily)